jgi:ABC-type antimicrobial peptide transport system permease subunit
VVTAKSGGFAMKGFAESEKLASLQSGAAASVSAPRFGFALRMWLNPLLAKWAKGNSRDPFVLPIGSLLLGLVSTIASAAPAWNASRLNPTTALWSD